MGQTFRGPLETSTWIIQNIPSFLKLQFSSHKTWRKLKVEQYKGYGLNLSSYESADAFIATQLSSRNRRKLRSKLGKLEKTGKIGFHFYYGSVGWDEHVENFDMFYDMLKKRFDAIKMSNRNLTHWPFFCLSSYRLINEKRAFLFVITKDDKPIAFSLNYIKENLCFGIFQTHDVEYNAYNPGDICMLKKLEWFYSHNIEFYDLAMGHNYFKEKWANFEYTFFTHIFYTDSFMGRLKAHVLKKKLIFIQFLRNKGVVGKLVNLDKLLYSRNMRKLEELEWKSQLDNLMDI
jgi:CelD/BcsL family acetyltransferase involved in cellulose biosynthesis